MSFPEDGSSWQPHSGFRRQGHLASPGAFMWYTLQQFPGLDALTVRGEMLILLLCSFVMLIHSQDSLLGLTDWLTGKNH